LERTLSKPSLAGGSVVVIVDDVASSLGLERLEAYIKWLYELKGKIAGRYGLGRVAVIATTSEGVSLERVARHTYNIPLLVWNLGEEAFRELAGQLNPPGGAAVEEAWRLTGGNPRMLIEVALDYSWNLDAWMDSIVSRVRPVALRLKAMGLAGEALKLAEDPDAVEDSPSPEALRAYEILVEGNLMMYTGFQPLASIAGGPGPSRNPELGVGRRYSWQMPAYRDALARLLSA
jgi:hypothetical protein